MKTFLKRKLVDPIVGFLKQGVSPSKLALAVSMGIVIATVPVFGASTILCLAAIWLFRLNPAAVLLVNQVAYPLQFLFYFPFIRSGEWLFNAHALPLTIEQIFHLITTDVFGAIDRLWWSTLYGLVIWIVFSMLAVALLYFLLKAFFTKTALNSEVS
jgi:uncharacterized protein (DUF2062 family)